MGETKFQTIINFNIIFLKNNKINIYIPLKMNDVGDRKRNLDCILFLRVHNVSKLLIYRLAILKILHMFQLIFKKV